MSPKAAYMAAFFSTSQNRCFPQERSQYGCSARVLGFVEAIDGSHSRWPLPCFGLALGWPSATGFDFVVRQTAQTVAGSNSWPSGFAAEAADLILVRKPLNEDPKSTFAVA